MERKYEICETVILVNWKPSKFGHGGGWKMLERQIMGKC